MSEIGLSEMIVALRSELLKAQTEGIEKDLKFKIEQIELEVELVTTKEGEGSGSVKFWVYNAEMKAKVGTERTHRLLLKLKPESSGGDTFVADDDTK